MSALVPHFATVAGLILAGFIACLIVRALWAEIGPMLALLFRRSPLAADDEEPRARR